MIEFITPDWPAPANIRAFSTTRVGGVSASPYDSLNLGLHVEDTASDVLENRRLLKQALDLPGDPCWINQTHSIEAVVLENESNRNADAAISRKPETIATVMTADCLPILLCNHQGSEVAAIHAGWKGLLNGVVEAALAQMESDNHSLIAWIGPAISQQNFEVDAQVKNAFDARSQNADAYFEANRPGHWLCDLTGLATQLLTGLGLEGVYSDPYCSFRDRELFYSYRREGVTGRMASLIWINGSATQA
ncbi:MAG: YfiH family protein [Planctomycetota bacterium]|jgi:YfiH family protein